jgi:hypothetical protein
VRAWDLPGHHCFSGGRIANRRLRLKEYMRPSNILPKGSANAKKKKCIRDLLQPVGSTPRQGVNRGFKHLNSRSIPAWVLLYQSRWDVVGPETYNKCDNSGYLALRKSSNILREIYQRHRQIGSIEYHAPRRSSRGTKRTQPIGRK